MDKRILFMGILSIFLLVAVSIVSVASSGTIKTTEKQSYSPLFGIRAKTAIGEKIKDLRANYLEGRIFFSFASLKVYKIDPDNMLPTAPTCCMTICISCSKGKI